MANSLWAELVLKDLPIACCKAAFAKTSSGFGSCNEKRGQRDFMNISLKRVRRVRKCLFTSSPCLSFVGITHEVMFVYAYEVKTESQGQKNQNFCFSFRYHDHQQWKVVKSKILSMEIMRKSTDSSSAPMHGEWWKIKRKTRVGGRRVKASIKMQLLVLRNHKNCLLYRLDNSRLNFYFLLFKLELITTGWNEKLFT